jgi:tRNA threonylcarbamoyl adenosine modification protein YeaZ
MAGALTLVLETSTPHASIALAGPDGVLEQRGFCSDRNHNALLFEPLRELLRGRRDEIGLVLVGSGPGSYSGTRVGIAAAQGVAIALGCPAVAVPSLLAVPSAAGGAECLAIGDARRGSFWTALGKEIPRLTDAAGLESAVSCAVDSGTPVFSFENPERFSLPQSLAGRVALELPDATRLWLAWSASDVQARGRWSAEIPQPLYLKPPHITPGKRPSLVRS